MTSDWSDELTVCAEEIALSVLGAVLTTQDHGWLHETRTHNRP
jgi:hypothetical protein